MSDQAVALDDSVLQESGHVCAFFNSRDQEYRVLLPFIQEGFERGEKAVHIVDPEQREDHLHRLQTNGIDVESTMLRKQLEIKHWRDVIRPQLEVRNWEEAYLRGGHFDQDKMLALIEDILNAGRAQQFPLTRLVAQMEWAQQDIPGVKDLVEYEARLNYKLPKYKDLVICVYDCAKFDGGVVMDLLRVHPVAIIGDMLQRNPFYMPPDEFLRELRKDSACSRTEGITAENRRLSKTVRDLVVLSGIPAAWVERDSGQTAEAMADMLLSMLRLAAVHVRLICPGESRADVCRCEDWPEFSRWLEAQQAAGNALVGFGSQPSLQLQTDRGPLSLSVMPIGINSEAGFIAVAAQRPEFPSDGEILLLSVAANQALLSFQNARAGYERKRAEGALLVLKEESDRAAGFEDMIGSSESLQRVLSQITKVAPTHATVLITGETGSGKERVAQAIHKRSLRADQPFITVNCAALPSSLVASELFGHEKGAFTGAHQRRVGRFELAEGGTIFLDEVGDLSADTQIALLRVLQEREFERVGGSHPIPADVRVIAATNSDLQTSVAAGTFREDLFYRLNVFPIEVPPLRQRKEDIPALVSYFIKVYGDKTGKDIQDIDRRSLALLQSYQWPGNIRELQNVIERSVVVSEGSTLSVNENWFSRPSTQPSDSTLNTALLKKEKDLIEAALRESKGRVAGPTGAARKLGIPASTLERRIRTLKIAKYRFRGR